MGKNLDVNAVVDCVIHDAGQVCAEQDELVVHHQIGSNEFQPFLQLNAKE